MDFANTKPRVTSFDIDYIDGTKTGIKVSLRHKSDPVIKDFDSRTFKEHVTLRDEGGTQEQISALYKDQAAERRFISIESWKWPKDATFKGETPELTLDFVSKVCGELDWFCSQIDRHLGNEVAFHPKLESVFAKP